MVLSSEPAASPLQTAMLIPHQRSRTEEIPKSIDVWQAASARNAKTEPHLPFQVVSPHFLKDTDSESHDDFEILPDCPSLSTDEALSGPVLGIEELEDPESDISSASGQSASLVSTPASREIEVAQVTAVHLSKWSEGYGNPLYASRMRMSQFHQEQSRVDWTSFDQTVIDALLGHPRPESGYFQLIGDGGSSFVYAAAFEGRRSNDTLAVKVLRSGKPYDTAGLPNEFQIMRRLKHNHIVASVSSIVRGDKVGVLLYPLARCNLAQYLKDTSENHLSCKGPDTAHTKILSVALGCLSSAVMYLHVSQNIKHKDIKPENILLDKYGSVLLADFGISKQYPDNTVTGGPTPFTKKYAPPEVVDQDPRDLSADIFSLGCVFLEMVTIIQGERLNNLNDAIFDGCSSDRHNYSQSLDKVGDWICHLKEIIHRETFPINSSSAGFGSTGDDEYIAGDQPLTEWHLDAILRMISKIPEERPSITDLYKLFKSFANLCPECQGNNNHSEQGQRCDSDTKFVIKATPLADSRSISDTHQPSILHPHSKVFCSQDKDQEPDSYQDEQSGTTTMERHLELALDEEDKDYSSEAESFDSDSSTLSDHEREVNAESARLFSGIRIIARNFLEKNDFDALLLKTKDSSPGAFNSHPVGGSTSARRQGSPIEGLPAKRRSIEQGKTLKLPEGDGQGDNEENPDDRRGKNEIKAKSLLRSGRPFACHFYQRDPPRYTNRACRESLWYKYSRVKEHLIRVHRIYRCTRCQEAFIFRDELHQHQREATACELRDRIFDDDYDWGRGFDDVQTTELKSRLRGVNDEEKWNRCYRVLFPRDGHVPSPYRNDQTAEFMSGLKANVSRHLSNHLSAIIQPRDLHLFEPLVESAMQAGLADFLESQQARDRTPVQQHANLTSTSSAPQQNPVDVNDLAPGMTEYLEVDHSAVQTEPNYDYSFSSDQSRTGIQQGDRINDTNDSAYYTTYNRTSDALQGGIDVQGDLFDQLINFQPDDDIPPSCSQGYSGSGAMG